MHSAQKILEEEFKKQLKEKGVEEQRTYANSRVHDFDDGLGGLAHVGEPRGGDGGWNDGRKADGHFRDDAEGSLCADKQLRRVKSGRRLARSTSRFYHLTRGKDNSLPEK